MSRFVKMIDRPQLRVYPVGTSHTRAAFDDAPCRILDVVNIMGTEAADGFQRIGSTADGMLVEVFAGSDEPNCDEWYGIEISSSLEPPGDDDTDLEI